MNLNTFIPGGASLTYKYLAEIQSDLANMEVSNQKFMQTLLTFAPEFYQLSKEFANEQASEQFNQGLFSMGSELTQGLVLGVSAGIGTFGIQDPVNPNTQSEFQVNATPTEDNLEGASLEGNSIALPNSDTEEVAEIDGTTEGNESPSSTKAASSTGAQNTAKSQQTVDQEYQKALEQAASKRNFLYQVVAPAVQHAASGSFQPLIGLEQAHATQDQGLAQYMQGMGGMINQLEQTTGSAIQNESGQEQAASQALLAVSQLSGPV